MIVKRISMLIITVFMVIFISIEIEKLLDSYEIGEHKLYTGIAGMLIIILSFMYSARRRKIFIKNGSLKTWLYVHEWLSILGTLIIFVHTGTHFHAAVPIVTLVLMFIAFISGLIGKYVHDTVKKELKQKKSELINAGLSEIEIDESLSRLTMTSTMLLRWRDFHMPLILVLTVMTVYHILSAMYFRGF